MRRNNVGIGNIGIYIPKWKIEIEQLTLKRPDISPKIKRGIQRASRTTGQMAIRFPSPWEDTATLGAQSAINCFNGNPNLDFNHLRYISVGTETTVDHSKPVAAYIQGMLVKAGLPVPGSLSTFQVQHACAGGTIGMLSVCSLLAHSPIENEKGLIICSDIARYQSRSTAEVTQGAGAVSLLIEKNPSLLEVDLETQGYYSEDVDDFFRPLGSVTAQVKGRYSINCFEKAFLEAFNDHCQRKKKTGKEVLEETDFFVLHTPFKSMPITAMRHLLEKSLDYTDSQIEKFMEDKGLIASVEPSAFIGNLYSGASYLSLAALLKNRHELMGDDIVGKKVILASYGSGNTMIVLSCEIAPDAPRIIREWDFDKILNQSEDADIDFYEEWTNSKEPHPGEILVNDLSLVSDGHFYLNNVRDDGYREYEYKS